MTPGRPAALSGTLGTLAAVPGSAGPLARSSRLRSWCWSSLGDDNLLEGVQLESLKGRDMSSHWTPVYVSMTVRPHADLPKLLLLSISRW